MPLEPRKRIRCRFVFWSSECFTRTGLQAALLAWTFMPGPNHLLLISIILRLWATKTGHGRITSATPNWQKRKVLPYRRSRSLIVFRCYAPGEEQITFYPHSFNPAFRGTSGPIQVSMPPHVYTIDQLFQQSFVNKGLKSVADPYGGDVRFSPWTAAHTR